MEPTPLEANISMSAMRLSLGLSVVTGEVAFPAPVCLVCDAPLVGMALKRESTAAVGAHRVILLVRGTTETVCEPIDPDANMAEQTFKVCSPAVRCLLSEEIANVNLEGYCDMKKMMQYRLDKEAALI